MALSRFVIGNAPFTMPVLVTCGILALFTGILPTESAHAEENASVKVDQNSGTVSLDFTFVQTVFGSVVLVATAEGPQKPKIFPNEHLLVQSDSFEVVKYAIARAKLYDVEVDVVETSQRYRFLSL